MKKLWMLVILLTLTIGAKANHYGSTIVIRSQGQVPILVKMDRHPAPQARPVHKYTGIRPGNHFVEIFRVSPPHLYGGHQPLRLVYRGYVRAQAGYKTVYVLHRGVLRQVSKKRLAQYNQGCSIHGNQHCNCSPGSQPWNNGYGGQGGHPWNNGSSSGPGYGHQGCNEGCGGTCGQPHGNNWNSWNNNGGGNGYSGGNPWGGGHDQYGGYQPMSYQDFWSFRNRMRKNVTDAGKVAMAKRELKENWLNTEQVGILLDDLFFEQQKLDLARSLYHRTLDPERYGELDSQFEFSSNKKQLSQYVERNAPDEE